MDQIHFTEKETDIYKIHQSGDLANLDGLDEESLKQLPSLLELRNAMYSAPFREYISGVANAGPLSGQKTDMAINVYTPGSHLLCHDDVIGSRRVSYILYLTDPDDPWLPEWGGALRLYPTSHVKQGEESKFRTPDPDFSASIPPAWNQMSFFAVQPGESFHDVEEVYHSGNAKEDQRRVRMAISGWYHIPQEGEEGYMNGAEEESATSSSLTQLQTKDAFDLPSNQLTPYSEYLESASDSIIGKTKDSDSDLLTTSEINYLLQFIAPNLLTPDGVLGLRRAFQHSSCVRIDGFLNKKFLDSIATEIQNQPKSHDGPVNDIESNSVWTVARPPHKHRYLFMLPDSKTENKADLLSKETTQPSPIKRLLSVYLPSVEFRKWLHLATGLVLRAYDIKARRFRRGADYQLATSYDEENPRLELTLGISPEGKWATEEVEDAVEDKTKKAPPEEINNGGYEVWMAPDDDDNDDDNEEKDEKNTPKPTANNSNGTGAHGTPTILHPKSKASTLDPAIYKSSTSAGTDNDDGGILFSMAAGWNRLSIVLRDSGTLRFVKYVSRAAEADRWDVAGDWDVDWDATSEFGDDDDEEDTLEAKGGDGDCDSNEDEVETEVDSDGNDTEEDENKKANESIRMSFTS